MTKKQRKIERRDHIRTGKKKRKRKKEEKRKTRKNRGKTWRLLFRLISQLRCTYCFSSRKIIFTTSLCILIFKSLPKKKKHWPSDWNFLGENPVLRGNKSGPKLTSPISKFLLLAKPALYIVGSVPLCQPLLVEHRVVGETSLGECRYRRHLS